MKSIRVVALLLLAGATCFSAQAGNKKDKKNKKAQTEAVAPVVLRSSADSLSYAAGYSATRGLLPYLQSRLNVDTAYLDDFVRGYQEAVAKSKDPRFAAYSAGLTIAAQSQSQIFPGEGKELAGTPDSLRAEPFHAGFVAGVKSDTTVYTADRAASLFQDKVKAVSEARNAAYKTENEQWLAKNAIQPGVNVLPSGLQYKVIKQGTGVKPTADQTVEVVYEGKTIDGNVFDATERHGGSKTDSFRCDQVIKGWTEALTNMPVGSKWEIFIPQNLAYGERQAGQIKPYSTLIFTVELVGIEQPKAEQTATKPSTSDKNTKGSKANTARRRR